MSMPDEMKEMRKKGLNSANFVTQSGIAMHGFMHSFDWIGLLVLMAAIGTAAQGFIGSEPYQWHQGAEKYVTTATIGIIALNRHLEQKRQERKESENRQMAAELIAEQKTAAELREQVKELKAT